MSVRTQFLLVIFIALPITGIFLYEGLKGIGKDYADDTYILKDEAYIYDLRSPVERYELPGVLREVSGLAWINSGTMACIQDEVGIVFFLNLESGDIDRELKFGGKGDYEGIAFDGTTYYVLRSDGMIYAFTDENRTEKIETALSARNNAEGIAWATGEAGLLIACKDDPGIKEKLDGRVVYRLPLAVTGQGPLALQWHILPNALGELLVQSGLNPKQHWNFRPSGIALHPTTDNVYIISYTGRLMIVLSQSGQPLDAVPLATPLLLQPEGVAFDDQGALYIASEGKQGKGYILKFDPVKQFK